MLTVQYSRLAMHLKDLAELTVSNKGNRVKVLTGYMTVLTVPSAPHVQSRQTFSSNRGGRADGPELEELA